MSNPFNFKYYIGVLKETFLIMAALYLFYALIMWDFNLFNWYKTVAGIVMYFIMGLVLLYVFLNYILGNDED